jgi:hypothetical protein
MAQPDQERQPQDPHLNPLPQGEEWRLRHGKINAFRAVHSVNEMVVCKPCLNFGIARLRVCRDFWRSPGKMPGTPGETV